MSSISVVCPFCGAELKTSGDLAMCPRCGSLVQPAAGGRAAHAEEWFYQVMGQEVGPLSFYDLKQCARERKVGPETPVRLGTGRWVLAERVTGLAGCWADGLEEWYFVRDGKRLGPVSFQALKSLITSGSLAPTDLVQRADWDAPVRVREGVEKELFPEPLPGFVAPEPIPVLPIAAAEPPPAETAPAPPPLPAALAPAASLHRLLLLAFLAGVATALAAVGLVVLALVK
jgi:ribosomal protein S27E